MSSSDGVRDGSRLPWFVRRNRRALSKFVEELVNLGWRRRGMDQFDCGSPGFVFVFQRVGRYFALILTLQKTENFVTSGSGSAGPASWWAAAASFEPRSAKGGGAAIRS